MEDHLCKYMFCLCLFIVAVAERCEDGSEEEEMEMMRGVMAVTAWQDAFLARFPNSDSRYVTVSYLCRVQLHLQCQATRQETIHMVWLCQGWIVDSCTNNCTIDKSELNSIDLIKCDNWIRIMEWP